MGRKEELPRLYAEGDGRAESRLRRVAGKVFKFVNSATQTERGVGISSALSTWLDSTSIDDDKRIEEFEDLPVDEIDLKLVSIAGVWQNREAYDVLVSRRQEAFHTDEDAFGWFTRLAHIQYGDLIYQR